MTAWFRQHRFAISECIARIARAPGSFAFNVMVIALALILPVAGLTVLENLRPVSSELAVEPEISVFLSVDLPRDKAQALATQIRQAAKAADQDARLEFITRESALNAMKDRAGLSDIVGTLGSNPLPDAYVLKLTNAKDDAAPRRIEKLAGEIRRLAGVELVQLDSAWVKRLTSLLQLAGIVLWMLAATLCGVVVAVVFNTIRLQVLTQSEEIAVSRLLGATDSFVARPFYYTGALLGLGAGALALLGVLVALYLLNLSVTELAQLYGSAFALAALEPAQVMLLLGASTALGIFGAALSVWRALGRKG